MAARSSDISATGNAPPPAYSQIESDRDQACAVMLKERYGIVASLIWILQLPEGGKQFALLRGENWGRVEHRLFDLTEGKWYQPNMRGTAPHLPLVRVQPPRLVSSRRPNGCTARPRERRQVPTHMLLDEVFQVDVFEPWRAFEGGENEARQELPTDSVLDEVVEANVFEPWRRERALRDPQDDSRA